MPAKDERTFIPLFRMASLAGVPETWLRAEVDAGRLPHLRTGRRILVNRDEIERALMARAAQAAPVKEADVNG
jgi:excisionase family DNA binding protein